MEQPEVFELRVVVWGARGCPHMDANTEANDMYIKVADPQHVVECRLNS